MGVADRDYMRQRPSKEKATPKIAVVVVVAIGLFLILSGAGRDAIERLRSHGRTAASTTRFGVSLGPGIDLMAPSPQAHDPWENFLAPESVCPGRADSSLPTGVQQRAAMCLLNYARQRQGLPPLAELAQLTQWSIAKATDIVSCNDFAHTPCGEAADRYARAAGFRGAFGENIFMGPQTYKTPLSAVDGWLNSDHHREKLFRREWRYQGIALLHTDQLRDQHDVAVWVSEFGT